MASYERDLAYGLATYGDRLPTVTVSELMTKAVIVCAPEDSVTDVLPKGSSCEMVVARIAVWRYPSRVQGTRAISGRFRIAALLFTDEAVVSGMVSYSRRKCACGR